MVHVSKAREVGCMQDHIVENGKQNLVLGCPWLHLEAHMETATMPDTTSLYSLLTTP